MDEDRYLHKLYGTIANRPFPELIRVVHPQRYNLINRVFGWNGQRYLENSANKDAGYVMGERSVWGHAASDSSCTEDTLRDAWNSAIKHKQVLKNLNTLAHKTKVDLLKTKLGVF